MTSNFVRWIPMGGICLLAVRLVACSSDVAMTPADVAEAGVARVSVGD